MPRELVVDRGNIHRDRRALVDLGAGARLGLHLDRYRYTYQLPGGDRLVARADASECP
jgi:hypothetical protein